MDSPPLLLVGLLLNPPIVSNPHTTFSKFGGACGNHNTTMIHYTDIIENG